MKRILITAPTGMLGSMVYNILKDDYELILVYRNKNKLELLDKIYGGVAHHHAIKFDLLDIVKDYKNGFIYDVRGDNSKDFLKRIGRVDAVINCAGIIKPYIQGNYEETLFINGALPRILGFHFGEKLIHLTTDCVFNGIEGAPYSETSHHSPNDFYGLSKSMGEPKNCSLVFRTSIIGPEIYSFLSLLEWVRHQAGKTIDGYVNHLWNGLTTKQFALICREVIEHRKMYPRTGLFHLFSNKVSKYEMVNLISSKYDLKMEVNPLETFPIDRRLRSEYEVCKKLKIPTFKKMLQEL